MPDAPPWEYVPARDAFSLASGLPYAMAESDPSGMVPIYGSNGIAGYGRRTLTTGPTIVIGRVGEGGVGSVRYVAEPAWITENALWADHIDSRWSPEFLAAYLAWLDLRRFRGQTGQPLITQAIVLAQPVPMPPLAEQQRITELIGSAENQVRVGEAALHKQRMFNQGLADDLLTGRKRVLYAQRVATGNRNPLRSTSVPR